MNRVDNATATPGGYSDTGNTTNASPIITALGSTGGVNVGDYVEVTAGFPDFGRLRVLGKTVNTITVNTDATSSETGVTVTSKDKMYTDGVPDSIARTVLNSKYMNMIQEEIANLIIKSGAALDEDNIKQLAQRVITVAGGTIEGALDITNTFIANSLGLHKTIAGTGADATADIIEKGGGKFTINSLAANSNVTLFEFGSVFDEKEFCLDALIHYNFPGQIRVAHTKLIVKTGAVSPTGIWGVAPQWANATQDSDTALNLGGYHINIATANDSDFDGTGNKNGVPLLLMRTNKMDLRNTFNSGAITDITVRIKTSGLL